MRILNKCYFTFSILKGKIYFCTSIAYFCINKFYFIFTFPYIWYFLLHCVVFLYFLFNILKFFLNFRIHFILLIFMKQLYLKHIFFLSDNLPVSKSNTILLFFSCFWKFKNISLFGVLSLLLVENLMMGIF